MSAYVEISQLLKSYPAPGGGESIIVKDFNLKIANGEFVTVIGHSGCGKSTQLMMLAGLTEITEGVIVIGGKEINGAGPDRGIVFQSPSLLPWMTARENVMLGVEQVFFTATKEERYQIAEYYLTVVGLGEAMDKYPAELSQGMRQRVGIARAFALKPKMLLLDEPFGMLDSLTRYELQAVLLQLWRKERITAMMVTHDVDEALYLSDRVVCMTDGPEATIGEILEVPFARPRDRKAVMEDPAYPRLRHELISFLEHRAHLRPGALIPPGGAISPTTVHGSDAPESASTNPTIAPAGASAAP
jgi:nitrate/nitrite transport system ATP-binding protein